jgi:flagellin
MSISLGTNIQSLQTQRQLNITQRTLSRTYERLSSGMRINRAADDAAGLSIADGLRVDQRIASVAIRNANDGISLITIADGAISEIGNILNRMAELSEQSANGVFSNYQRSALQSEFQALGSEIQRIAVTTEFNDLSLLSSPQGVALQVGFDSASTSQIMVPSVNTTLSALGLAVVGSAALTFSLIGTTVDLAQSASRLALDAVRAAINSVSAQRGQLGGSESRLRTAISSLQIARESFAAAEAQIRDADIAEEAASLTRLGILQQAGASVLAQANQQPQLALQLLGS